MWIKSLINYKSLVVSHERFYLVVRIWLWPANLASWSAATGSKYLTDTILALPNTGCYVVDTFIKWRDGVRLTNAEFSS